MLLSKTIIAVSVSTIRRAECQITRCERCDRTADTPFSRAFVRLGIGAEDTDCLMCEPAKCPACGGLVLEHTLVELL